ncbi:MAG: NADH-quinone oxidoreductase subunit C [Desulfurivibrio sp.]|jgi:ech hydrogenase subunit D|nr:MAG: NADH-quinone oxidoreductase subunit C [Desulfurivibrio sp.]
MSIAADSISCVELCRAVAACKEKGCRFVTITCVGADSAGAELLYHFDRELALSHLRLTVSGDEVPSISGIYAAAFLVENEIQDQFGLVFTGLAPDYRRTLFLDGQESPPPFRRDRGPDQGE